jgi:hypothetical protein
MTEQKSVGCWSLLVVVINNPRKLEMNFEIGYARAFRVAGMSRRPFSLIMLDVPG